MTVAVDNSRFRRITPGIETLPSSFSLPRHRHLHAYATVVLAGCFVESGYNGRIQATAGDVLIHPALDCHGNQMVSAGVKLIRLEWHDETGVGGLYHLDEVDLIARSAEKDLREATHLLERALRGRCRRSPGQRDDWPDLLLTDLANDCSTEIGEWAQTNGLARETVSRGFTLAYGVAPSVLRAELRTKRAWFRITRGSDCLSRIAADVGFADQAHMTRWVHRITGAPPAVWRQGLSGVSSRMAKRLAPSTTSDDFARTPPTQSEGTNERTLASANCVPPQLKTEKSLRAQRYPGEL